MIICLDAGHTPGVDPGACGNELQESDLTGDICERVAIKLSSYDVDVRQIPRTDSLNVRCAYANALNASAFISIHINAGGGTGFESYVCPSMTDRSTVLSDSLHRACMEYMSPLGMTDRGKKFASFAVLKNTVMPAVLLECLFIDNLQDAAWLKNDSFLDGLANAIAWGLVQALELKQSLYDPTVDAIKALQAKGVVIDPDYWLSNAKAGKQCDGGLVALLIRNFASKI